MKFYKFFLFLFILSIGYVKAQDVKTIKYEELLEMVNQNNDQLIVVNFWATWCGPCVSEMPHFTEVNEKYKDNPNFKLLLVSMDRVKQLESVKKFITANNINAEVVLLDDNKRMNEWIPKIDKSWSGNIPVTAFFQNGEKVHFVGQEMSKNELEHHVETYIK